VEFTLGVLPSERRRGIGSQLLAAAEDAARELGRATVVAYSDHPDTTDAARRAPDGGGGEAAAGPCSARPTATPSCPPRRPAAAFAAAHGYALGQLERVSSIAVDGRTEEFRRLLEARTDRAAAEGYRLELWTDRTPERLVDAYAAARARMVLDVPAGGVTLDEERWDAARVREHESEELDGGTGVLVAAAVTDDGEVAGYTGARAAARPRLRLPVRHPRRRPAPGPRARHAREAREPRAPSPRRHPTHGRLHVERRRERAHAGDQRRARLPAMRLEAIWQRELDEATLRPTRADAASGAAGTAGSDATSGS
jgi:GNAT superfamily N-acetyltransferase